MSFGIGEELRCPTSSRRAGVSRGVLMCCCLFCRSRRLILEPFGSAPTSRDSFSCVTHAGLESEFAVRDPPGACNLSWASSLEWPARIPIEQALEER